MSLVESEQFVEAATSATLTISIKDADSGKPVFARCVVNGARKMAGARAEGAKPLNVGGEPSYIVPGRLDFKVPPGRITVKIERGLEYNPVTDEFDVAEGAAVSKSYEIRRWVDMAKRGWWSGETHVHLPKDQKVDEFMSVQVPGEDLNVGTCLTSWISREDKAEESPVVKDFVRTIDDRHVYSVNDQEIERFPINRYCGPVYLVNMKRHIHLDSPNASSPLAVEYMKRARKEGALAVLHSAVFYDAPVCAALGQVDAIEIACNFLGYNYTMRRVKTYGNEDDLARYGDTEQGTVEMVVDKYYRLLNCGFRIPASGGSAAAVKGNPVGGNRAYVKFEGDLKYERWMDGLQAGRSFSTNGPMILLTVNGKEPGDTLETRSGDKMEARVEALFREPLSRLEVVRNGKVVETLEATGDGTRIAGSVEFPAETSGWIAARAWGKKELPVRLAHTSPIYVKIPGKPQNSAEDAAYFAKWIQKRMEFNETDPNFPSEKARKEVQGTLRKALKVYEEMAKK